MLSALLVLLAASDRAFRCTRIEVHHQGVRRCSTGWSVCEINAARRKTEQTPTALHLDLGGFFGGNKDKDHAGDDDESALEGGDNKNSVLLRNVKGLMDSMENLERAQRVGKLTTLLLQEFQSTTVEGVARDGKVKVLTDLGQKPVKVSIDDGYFSDSQTTSSDVAESLTAALQDAHAKSLEKMNEKLKSLYGEFGLSP